MGIGTHGLTHTGKLRVNPDPRPKSHPNPNLHTGNERVTVDEAAVVVEKGELRAGVVGIEPFGCALRVQPTYAYIHVA